MYEASRESRADIITKSLRNDVGIISNGLNNEKRSSTHAKLTYLICMVENLFELVYFPDSISLVSESNKLKEEGRAKREGGRVNRT